jgi:hypothetical protein
MRKVLLIVAAMVLAGCTRGVDPVARADSTEIQCRIHNPTFQAYALCVRDAVASDSVLNTGASVDLTTRYLAGVRLLSGQIANGEIDVDYAFWASAEYYGELKREFLGRRASAAAVSQQRAAILSDVGLRLMELGAPHTLGPAPPMPGPPVTTRCWTDAYGGLNCTTW